jgi:hypothetical protein
MKFFIIFCVFIGVGACNNEKFHRNRLEFDSSKTENIDKHATTAWRLKRNSFLPPQTPSNRDYFRAMISRTSDGNDNTVEYAIDPPFWNNNQPRQRKPQPEIFSGSSFRTTREVQVKQGKLTGIVREMPAQSRLRNVDQFLGVPYAEAPVGSRRFMPPSSPLSWQGTKQANRLEAVCPQRLPSLNDLSKGRYDQIKRLLPFLKRESEDCLYLNLYVTSYGELFWHASRSVS